MTLSGITFSGLASGLDTQALIAALVAVEQRPIQLMQSRRAAMQSRIDLFSRFSTLLETLQSKASGLSETDSFISLKTTLSETGYFTATATGTAQAASHEIQVKALALTGRNGTVGYADSDTTTFGTGTIDITVGTTTTQVAIDAENNTLQGIVTAINESGAAVHASIIDDGSATPYRLVIEGDDSGAANALSVTVNLSGGAALTLDAALDRAAQDAEIVADGITIKRSTNDIEGAIQGVTLNLIHETATGQSIRLDVAVDQDAIQSDIQSFVDAYNAVFDFINQQARYDETIKSSGPLAGDTTLRTIQMRLQNVIVSQLSDDSLPIRSLGALGVELDNNGRLSIDTDKLEEALAGDLEQVALLFTHELEGVGVRLDDLIEQFTDPLEGMIQTRKDALRDVVENLDDSIERAQDRLDIFEENLVKRFAAFETLIGRLNAQGSFLTTQLGYGSG
ncbi:MAG: flagellar filament capping protein FliD [Planctomycetota bacterium]